MSEPDAPFDLPEEITQRLDALREAAQRGKPADRKKAVAAYNQLARRQNAERDQFIAMTDQYNRKVAALRDLQE